MVGEFVAHDSSPQFGSLNHGSPAKRNAPGTLVVRRLRTGADINQPSISAKCVENDPKRTMLDADAARSLRLLNEKIEQRGNSASPGLIGRPRWDHI